MAVPTRSTSSRDLDQFNLWLHQQPWYQQFMQQSGVQMGARGNTRSLSRSEQSMLEQTMQAHGVRVPGGMHIDQGGNLNQKNRLVRNTAIGAGITGAALTGFGLAGMGPLAGLGGAAGGSAAAGGAAAAAGGTAAAAGGGVAPLAAGLSGAGLYAGQIIPAGQAATTLAAAPALSGIGLNAAASGGFPTTAAGTAAGTTAARAARPGGGGAPSAAADAAGGFDWRRLLAQGLPALGGLLAGRMAGGDGGNGAMPTGGNGVEDILNQLPQLRQVLDLQGQQAQLQTHQAKRADPLLLAAQQLAMNLLPNTAFAAGPQRPDLRSI